MQPAARYEEIDYSHSPRAGRGTAATGVNWCLDDFGRLQLNAIDWTIVSLNAKGMIVNDHG